MRRYAIYIIIFLAFSFKLYQINSPILGYHSWRQADTAAIARNFHEQGYQLFYPQIDWGGNSAGYVETEFQIYPFVVALLYKIFGVKELVGRFLSVIFSLVTIYTLYLLVRKHINEKVALWTCMVYSILPLNLYYSRAFMPESGLIMCSVVGIYMFSQWITYERWIYFFVSAFFITMACLIKIPSLYLGLPLLYLAWLKFGKKVFAQKPLWFYSMLIFIPVELWYYHAHQIYLEYNLSFGIWDYGVGKWGNWELLFNPEFYNRIFLKSIAERHLTWAGLVVFIIGLFIKRKGEGERLFDFWLISVLIYFAIAAQGNRMHEYYQLPFIAPATVFVGKSFSKYLSFSRYRESSTPKRLLIAFIILCGISILTLGSVRYYKYMKAEDVNSPKYILSQEVRQKTEEDALIITVDNREPTILYLSHRKGWCKSSADIDDGSLIKWEQEGARYLVGIKGDFERLSGKQRLNQLLSNYRTVASTDDYFIVKLKYEDF